MKERPNTISPLDSNFKKTWFVFVAFGGCHQSSSKKYVLIYLVSGNMSIESYWDK